MKKCGIISTLMERGMVMKKENLTVNMKKFNDLLGIEENQSLKIKRNLYLKGIHDGKILGPKTNIPDVDKDWLKNYSIDDIKNCSVPQETIYSYILKNNIDNIHREIYLAMAWKIQGLLVNVQML